MLLAEMTARASTSQHLLVRLHRHARRPARSSCSAASVDGGLPAPFHVYTMQQAIEEGFILDVLRNYTSYAPPSRSRPTSPAAR